MTPRTYALASYLTIQAHRAATLRDALTMVEADLDADPMTRNAVTHEVVQKALRQATEAAEALAHEAKVLGGGK